MLFASLFVKAGGDVTIKVDGIYYHYYDDEVTEVTEVSVAKGDEPYSGDIIVPSQITYNGKTYAVTSIHWFAFQNANLTSLQLPGTITSIEWGAFDGMTGLTSLVIPEGVTTIEGIGGIDLRRLTLPASLKQIRSFYGDNLEAVCLKSQTPPIILDYPNPDVLLVVPSDCRNAYQQDDKWGRMPWIAEGNGIPLDIDISFEENGFIYQIYSLVDNTVEVNNHLLRSDPNRDLYQGDIVIPKQFDHKGTTYIPVGIISIFGEGVTSISLPPTITHIRDRAFEGNWGMTSFTMEEGVAEIGKYAFADCHLLTSIRLPKSLLRLSSDAFANCFSFANIVVAEGNPVYSSPDGCNAIIENATSTLIIGSANTTVPEGILKIAPYAFAGNRS